MSTIGHWEAEVRRRHEAADYTMWHERAKRRELLFRENRQVLFEALRDGVEPRSPSDPLRAMDEYELRLLDWVASRGDELHVAGLAALFDRARLSGASQE